MSIKQRAGTWHCDFVTPGGSRIRRSLGTTDKRQAQELYDRLKAEAWRVDKMGSLSRERSMKRAFAGLTKSSTRKAWTMTKAGSDSGDALQRNGPVSNHGRQDLVGGEFDG